MEKVKLLVIEVLLFPITFLNAMILDSSAVLISVSVTDIVFLLLITEYTMLMI